MKMVQTVVPSLPGVSFSWQRKSRRRGELVVRDGGRIIFHADTDGREWTPDDVCAVLRSRPPADPMGMGE